MSVFDRLLKKTAPRYRARDIASIASEQARREILAQPRYVEPLRLLSAGRKVFSQGDEDGIIAEIFRRIGTTTKTFCEIGVGDGRENNTLALLYQGWRGIWLEASKRRCDAINRDLAWAIASRQVQLVPQMVSIGNAPELSSVVAGFNELDLFSIDIDGIDWHVMRAIPALGARVVIVEYNAKFAPPIEFAMTPADNFRWQRDDYFSASLSTWEALMRTKGYALVGCGITGVNAYFVRQDLAQGALFCEPFTAANHFEPARYYLVSGWSSGHPTSMRAPYPL